MAKFKRKPTMKEMANVVIEINKKVNENYSILRQLDDILGLYVDMKGDMKEFHEFLKKKFAERDAKDDKKADGKIDIPDIQEQSEDKGSGAEGVREEAG